jgi:hypothetical protein
MKNLEWTSVILLVALYVIVIGVMASMLFATAYSIVQFQNMQLEQQIQQIEQCR